jgi:hypothetical protein
MIGAVEWLLRRERDLARRGELATGRITHAGISSGKSGKTWWIGFTFALPSGEEVQGRSKVTREYFESLGQVGEEVAVLWDPRRPRRCQALPGMWFTAFPTVTRWIRILSAPPGEAPADVRAAWVGCVLPLFATSGDPRVGRQPRGVLSGQAEDHRPGFAVPVIDAVRELEHHNARAAQWWLENTPHLIRPGKLFVFPREVCELVDEDFAAEPR